MTSVVHSDPVALREKHHDNVVSSLHHRLEVAKARHDARLIELLEQEEKQLIDDVGRESDTFKHRLAILWDDLLGLVRGDSSLKVWQTTDRRGDRWWCAYDPHTGKSIYTDSETEMRIWIEQNYTADV